MLKNLTIKSRLIFVIGFMSALLASIGLLGLFGISKANEGLRSVYEDRTVALGQVANIEALLLNNRLRIAVSLVTPTPEVIKENAAVVEKNIEEIGKTWEMYMATTLTPEEKKLADQFAEDRKKFVGTGLKPTMAALREGNIKEANRLVVDVIRPTYKPVGEGILALKQLQLDVAKQEYAQAQSSYATIRNITLSAIVIGIALSIWIGFMLIRAIVRPVNEAVAVANAVAAGDLTSKIQVTAKDETGMLMQALKDMNENLVRLVGDVRVSADTITTASKEIAAGNADLSQRTEEQASSLEETASSMEELTSTVKQNAENAKQANQLAKGASEVAIKGGDVVGQVVGTMAAIQDSSRKIVDIISVIDGIAFQTNILALNAAVEAARAGEQGRGFAVVAGEVRNLAQRSAAAAKEIKTLIGDSVEKVDGGTKLVEEAGRTMEEIVSSVKRVTDIMSEITAASLEQSSGIEQVNQAVTQMDEVTQQNAALVEEAAAAAESMEEQAQALTATVAIFKLDGGQQKAPAKTERAVVAQAAPRASGAPVKNERRGQPQPKPKSSALEDDWNEF